MHFNHLPLGACSSLQQIKNQWLVTVTWIFLLIKKKTKKKQPTKLAPEPLKLISYNFWGYLFLKTVGSSSLAAEMKCIVLLLGCCRFMALQYNLFASLDFYINANAHYLQMKNNSYLFHMTFFYWMLACVFYCSSPPVNVTHWRFKCCELHAAANMLDGAQSILCHQLWFSSRLYFLLQ